MLSANGSWAALLWLAVLSVLLHGCGAAPTPPEERSERPPLGELALLIPSGAQTIVVARPRELFRSRPTAVVLDAVVPENWILALANRTGVDLRLVEDMVFATYPEGFVLLFQGPWPAADAVRGNGARMSGIERSERRPFVRRTGFLGTDHRDLIALSDHVVLVAAGVPSVARIILERVGTGSWPQGVAAALSDAETLALLEAHRHRPAVLYAPHPLDLPPGYGTSLLLARERALAVALHSGEDLSLALELSLVGEFPPGAETNFRTLVESLAESALGSAFGMHPAAQTLAIEAGPESVKLRMSFSARAVALGLRTLFVADIRELLGDDPEQANPE